MAKRQVKGPRPFLRIDKRYDVERLERDLAIAEEVHGFIARRHIPGKNSAKLYRRSRGWSAIPLRSPGGVDGEEGNRYGGRSAEPYAATRVLARCGYFAAILEDLESDPGIAEVRGARIMRLAAGGVVAPHKDPGFARGIARLHVPVVTHRETTMTVAGRRKHMAAGSLWYTNVSDVHSVDNRSPVDRVHLVVDVELAEPRRNVRVRELRALRQPMSGWRMAVSGTGVRAETTLVTAASEVEPVDRRWRALWGGPGGGPSTIEWERWSAAPAAPPGPRLAIVTCQYRRVDRFERLLAQVHAAAAHLPLPCDLFVWVNRCPEEPGAAARLARAVEAHGGPSHLESVRLHASPVNLAGLARLVVAALRSAEHEHFVFLDDDVEVPPLGLRTLYDEARSFPRTILSHWTHRFTDGTSYGRRSRVRHENDFVHYAGTAGMIAPALAFSDPSLLTELPERFRRVEDLWLCSHFQRRHGGDLRHSRSGIRCVRTADVRRVSLHRQPGVWKRKTELLRHLVEEHDWPWRFSDAPVRAGKAGGAAEGKEAGSKRRSGAVG